MNVFGHNCDKFCTDHTDVGILQVDGQVVLCSFLQHHDHAHLEAQVILSYALGNFADETLEGALA